MEEIPKMSKKFEINLIFGSCSKEQHEWRKEKKKTQPNIELNQYRLHYNFAAIRHVDIYQKPSDKNASEILFTINKCEVYLLFSLEIIRSEQIQNNV